MGKTQVEFVQSPSKQRETLISTGQVDLIFATYSITDETPLTLILTFTIFVMLYDLGISLADESSPTSIVDNGVRWAIVGLAIYHAAFVCEAIRSGINTVPPGQAEAARSIGLGFSQNPRQVVLAQALRGAIAPLASVPSPCRRDCRLHERGPRAARRPELRDLRPRRRFFLLVTLPIGIGLTSLSRRMAVQR